MAHTPQEPTVLNVGLLVFYASCAVVSIGAAITASAWLVFQNNAYTIGGSALIAIGTVGCLMGLRAARKESSSRAR